MCEQSSVRDSCFESGVTGGVKGGEEEGDREPPSTRATGG